MAEVSERIKMLREAAGLSQFGLAKALDIHPATISNYETGKREPDLGILRRMSDYFNVTIDFLSGKEDIIKTGTVPSEISVMFRSVDWSKLPAEDKAIVNAVLKSVTEKHRNK